jgi:hypothetical protein
MAIEYNKTYTQTIENVSFGTLDQETLNTIFRDGRTFSLISERWVAKEYNLKHITGCKGHDLVDPSNPEIKYEQKTFTSKGCKIMPSNMIGKGRVFDPVVFKEKAEQLNYVIVSNIKFPEIHTRFVKGVDLVSLYPNGVIHVREHNAFFGITS